MRVDRSWLGYAAVVALGTAMAIGAADVWRHDWNASLEHFRQNAASDTRTAAQAVEGKLSAIYENIRTLSFLPSVRTISRHGENLSEEARLTFQQVYNNLANSVAISEVYILPADLDPDRIDPETGKGEEPILMFDELIVDARDRFLAANPEAEVAIPAYPEEEIYEYRQMREQMAWLRQNYPALSSITGLAVPMVSGAELITCDNTYFIHTLNDADRSGIVFIVPFYGTDGKLRGGVSAIILSRALHDMLPSGNFALINTANDYATPSPRGQAVESAAYVKAGQPDPRLIYSEVLPLQTPEQKGSWALWSGLPDASFYDSPEVSQLRTTAWITAAAIASLTIGGLLVWMLITRNMRATAEASAKLERRVAERTAEIQFLATHDTLTGLANRTQLIGRLEDALSRGSGPLAVLAMDLDHFKIVNDTLGHPAGDKLLKEVGTRLRAAISENDVVARFGGDEFVVASPGSGPREAEQLARACIEAIQQPFMIDARPVHIGLSVGISLAPTDGDTAEQLHRNADIALYRAKDDGRGTSRFFEPAMDALLRERHKLEADLRRAIENEEFVLHYQPLVSAEDHVLTGFEALVRWQHPERGLLPPAAFIPLAEDTGLINPLGEWVLRRACADAAGWPGALKVAVNLSPAQFRQQVLAHSVVGALDASGLLPHRLELEITESALLLNNERTLATLHQIKALGVRIAMDDFGTGFSSLSYLRAFPFDRIKIDRSFVSDMAEDAESLAIVSAVVALGHSLGMKTTAEGIETDAQMSLVSEQGCTDLQGFLFGEAVCASDVPNAIARLATDRAHAAA
jgi:diguanylate cyclase (GGDEF)-like protein